MNGNDISIPRKVIIVTAVWIHCSIITVGQYALKVFRIMAKTFSPKTSCINTKHIFIENLMGNLQILTEDK